MLNQDYPINYGQYKQGLLKTLHFSCVEGKRRANKGSGTAGDKLIQGHRDLERKRCGERLLGPDASWEQGQ